MDNEIITNTVTVAINGIQQTSDTLFGSAGIEGVGNGGAYMAEALVDTIEQINRESIVPVGSTTALLNDLERLIDYAAGEAIRDIAVRAEVLKRQLTQKVERIEKLRSMLSGLLYIKGASMLGKPDSNEGRIFAAFDEIDGLENMADEICTVFQGWIEEDHIEGVFSNDFTQYFFDATQVE